MLAAREASQIFLNAPCCAGCCGVRAAGRCRARTARRFRPVPGFVRQESSPAHQRALCIFESASTQHSRATKSTIPSLRLARPRPPARPCLLSFPLASRLVFAPAAADSLAWSVQPSQTARAVEECHGRPGRRPGWVCAGQPSLCLGRDTLALLSETDALGSQAGLLGVCCVCSAGCPKAPLHWLAGAARRRPDAALRHHQPSTRGASEQRG